MSRLAILILGMVLGATAVVLTFSIRLDPGRMQIDSRVHATVPPEEPAVAPVEAEPISGPAFEPISDANQAALPTASLLPIPAPSLAQDPGLLIPVSGILPKQLSDTFTQSRGEGRLHDAIDIMAPRGTPVVAVADGRIAKLFNSKPGGLTVYQFDVEEKLAYYYAHLDSYAPTLVEGQLVRRGDVIGYVGSTGNASPEGPHLHFAIFILGPDKKWWQGTAINPYPLLGGG